jgi:hypothetical protein
MPKLILNNNYLLRIVPWEPSGYIPNKNIRKSFDNHYKFIKQNENKIVFNDGKKRVTLWNTRSHHYGEYYMCYITQEKNKNYRTTKYSLNSNSVLILVKIHQIELKYFKSYSCIVTLTTLLFLIDFYNKINIKKNLKKVVVISKVFQNKSIVRYISEYL